VLLAGLNDTGDGSLAVIVFTNVATGVGYILATPFAAAITVVLYFDLRVPQEGFDLQLLAEHMSAGSEWQIPGPPAQSVRTSPACRPTPPLHRRDRLRRPPGPTGSGLRPAAAAPPAPRGPTRGMTRRPVALGASRPIPSHRRPPAGLRSRSPPSLARRRSPGPGDVGSARLHQLAARAASGDRRALTQLEASTASTAGRPNVAGALEGARGADLAARLRELARGERSSATGGSAARRDAGRILSEGRFHRATLPHPLRRPLRALGRWITDAVDAIAGIPAGREGRRDPAARRPARGIRGADRAAHDPSSSRSARRPQSGGIGARPGRRATRAPGRGAERTGDHAARCGCALPRACSRSMPPARSSTAVDADGAVRRALRSERFDGLARTFDAITYGGPACRAGRRRDRTRAVARRRR